jgi:hypothetical protein
VTQRKLVSYLSQTILEYISKLFLVFTFDLGGITDPAQVVNMPNIVVIGYVTYRKCLEVPLTIQRAGVSGLTTALLLSKDPGYKVTILAKHMPGDYDIGESVPSCCEFIMRLLAKTRVSKKAMSAKTHMIYSRQL